MNKEKKNRKASDKSTHGTRETDNFDNSDYNTKSWKPSSDILSLIGTGEDQAIHQRELAKLTGLSTRDITLQIEQLRRSGAVILSSHKGYFKPETMSELTEYINRERGRAYNILRTLKTAEKCKKEREKINV